ncbi:MAG TPA: hypothetical protein DDW50_14565 [Firmicutes bacterium]|jgi:ABC-type xylose transport system substrate-binding protein|nr:hypothetical protein [Bacillota bacterium]
MLRFIKANWVLVAALCLLVLMSMPLIYFGNLLKIIGSQNEGTVAPDDAKDVAVGVCFNSFMEARWMKEWAVMQESAKAQGLTIQLKVAHHSLTRQISQITNLLAHHIQVLILDPVSSSGLEDVLEEARNQGVKIIFYDEITAGPGDFFLGIDYRGMGRLQAKALLEKAGMGNYMIFKGPVHSYHSEMLYDGQQEILKMKNDVFANVVSINALTNWSADEAVTKIRATITHQKLQAILAPEDLIAEEVANFYKEQKSSAPYITGAGAELTACQRVLHQEQLMTVAWNIPGLAKTAILSAKRMIQKKNAMGSMMVIENRRIQASIFPVYLVGRDNLRAILIDKLKLYSGEDFGE